MPDPFSSELALSPLAQPRGASSPASEVGKDPPQPLSSNEMADNHALLDAYPEFLGPPHLMKLFDRSARTVRGWMASGNLPVTKVGQRRFVPKQALLALLQELSR